MAKREGEGERRERLRRRRIIGIIAATGLVGGIVGGLLGAHGENLVRGESLPAWLAISAALVTVVGTIAAAIVYFRQIDELERQVNYWTANITIYYYLTAYFAWYLLWKGALVPEPSHEAMFASTFLVMILAYFWKKLRP